MRTASSIRSSKCIFTDVPFYVRLALELIRPRRPIQMTFRPSFNSATKPILDSTNRRRPSSPISAIPRNLLLLVFAALLVSLPSSAQTSILTHHYDTARTGQNTGETVLNPTNVNSTTFGKLFTLTVDGYVYAQPLYVPALVIPGNGTH